MLTPSTSISLSLTLLVPTAVTPFVANSKFGRTSHYYQKPLSSASLKMVLNTPADVALTTHILPDILPMEECAILDIDTPESIGLSHHILEEEIEEFVDEKAHPENAGIVVTWEPDVADKIMKMVDDHRAHASSKGLNRPFMVGVVGIPGSGKTTSCHTLASLIDDSLVVPMDGYHLPLDDLKARPDAEAAIYRRGAPDTFHPSTLHEDLKKIIDPAHHEVLFPGFDHGRGDPEPDAHRFVRDEHEVVICEGIYLLHDQDGWHDIKNFFDFTIYIGADVDFCVDRLKIRNRCIPGYTPEEIDVRCDEVDRVNALTVEKSRQYAHHEVSSAF